MRLRGILIAVVAVLSCLGVTVCAVALASSGGGPDPALKEWPNWPGKVSCGALSVKPQVAFAHPTGAELGDRPSEVALRETLTDGDFASVDPRPHGWRLLAETSRYAEFGNGRLGGYLETLGVAHRKNGWRAVGYTGGCEPAVVRGGRRAITWKLAAGQHLGPRTRAIKVHLVSGECDSGRSENDRLETPVFREESGALLMTLWERPVRGAQTCEELIEPPVKIRLPHRLGRLELLDGSVFPPLSPWREH